MNPTNNHTAIQKKEIINPIQAKTRGYEPRPTHDNIAPSKQNIPPTYGIHPKHTARQAKINPHTPAEFVCLITFFIETHRTS